MTGASPAHVARYLERIGFAGQPRADLATLMTLHRRHVEGIAWECLDCYAGNPTSRDPLAAFDKIVTRGRGGWCYEMNGLFAWILEGIGFQVTRLAAGVMRDTIGDAMIGNHLALIVRLDQDYLADVGLGSGLIEPVPLAEGIYHQRFATYRLERLDDRWWRFHNQSGVLPPSFDFALDVRDDALLEDRCRWLHDDPASPFRQNAVVQRYFADRLESLIGSKLIRISAQGAEETPIASAAGYDRALRDTFGLDVPEAEAVWSKITAAEPQPLAEASAAA
jgi:N-hydroxyarylamine O-acetyltransferase